MIILQMKEPRQTSQPWDFEQVIESFISDSRAIYGRITLS